MAAPEATIWGPIVNDMARLGLYITTSSTATQTTATIDIWLYTKYSVSDTSNTLYYADQQSNPTTSHGSVNIQTTSNNAWNELNQVRIANGIKVTHSRGTSDVNWTFGAKLTGVEYVGATMLVSTTWKAPALQKYTVSYNANGGSGAPGSQTKWYGKSIKLSSTKPTRTGYSFQGWATSSGGSVAYQPGATYSANAGVTLYAIWKANTYTVSYNANGGSGAPGSQTKTYGVTLKLSTTKPTRTNYNFMGWGTSPSSTTVAYAAGANYTANAGITLYAIWQLAYKPPRLTNLSVDRCTSDGTLEEEGTYARVRFNWSCDRTVSSVKIEYKTSTASTYTAITVTASGTSGAVDKVIGGSFSTDLTYNVRVTVADSGGNIIGYGDVAPTEYLIDVRPNGVAIGKPAEKANTFEVDYQIEHNRLVKNKGGTWVHWTSGTEGAAGYFRICRIKINSQYANTPIKITFVQRGIPTAVDLYILFSNAANADPTLQYFRFVGTGNTSEYIVKSSTSTWDVYVKKMETYDSIAVIEYSTNFSHMGNGDEGSKVEIEWTSDQVSTLPAGYQQAEDFLAAVIAGRAPASHNHQYVSTVNTLRFATDWMGFYGSAANAVSGTSRKGWIGYNGGTNMEFRNEAGGAMRFYTEDIILLGLNADNSMQVGGTRRNSGENTTIWGYTVQFNGGGGGVKTNATIQNVSDRRMKDNIEDIPDEFISVWKDLMPKIFTWNELADNGEMRKQFGLIAQDVIEVFTKHGLDYREYGFVSTYDKDGIEYFTVAYDHYHMLTALTVRRQQAEIDELKSQMQEVRKLILKGEESLC